MLDTTQQVQVQGVYTPCAAGGAALSANLVVQIHPAPQGSEPKTLSVLVTGTAGQVLIYSALLARQ